MKTVYLIVLWLFLSICCLCFVNSSDAFSGKIKETEDGYDLDPGHELPFSITCTVSTKYNYASDWIVFHFDKRDDNDSRDYNIFLEYTHTDDNIDKVTFNLTHENPGETIYIYIDPDEANEIYRYYHHVDPFKGLNFTWTTL